MSSFINFVLLLRAWIHHEHQVAMSNPSALAGIHHGHAHLARSFDNLAEAYRDLTVSCGAAPTGDLLLRLGPVGELIHLVVCQTAGTWEAYRRGVERRFTEIPFRAPLVCCGHTFQSVGEQLVFHALQQQADIVVSAVHPQLGASRRRADFLLTAPTTGRSALAEVTMLSTDPSSTGNSHHNDYRRRLAAKLVAYADLGLEPPVIIDADDLAPDRLDAKMAEIRQRLGLHRRSLQPPGGFERECAGGLVL